MKKINLIILCICVVLSLVMYGLNRTYTRQTNEILRLKNNAEVLNQKITTVKRNDSILAWRNKVLTLTLTEFREKEKGIKRDLMHLQLKYKDLNSITKIQAQTLAKFKAQTRDTIINNVNHIDTILVREYKDRWITYKEIDNNVSITVNDSLIVFRHCKTRKFLWWTCKKYSGEVTITSSNPYTTIKGITTIDIEK